MADKNQVVYLGTAPDASLADGSAVHARISLYLDVILDHHTTRLQNFAPAAVLLFCKSEAICSDYYTVLQDHAIPDTAVLPHRHVRVRELEAEIEKLKSR